MREQRLGGLSVKVFPGRDKSPDNLLYLHGFPGPIPGINPKPKLAPQLCQKIPLEIFAPEYSGLGDSDGDFRFLSSIDDIQRVFDQIRVQSPNRKTHIIGYSWGALPALHIWKQLAEKDSGHLILLAPAVVHPGRPIMLAIIKNWISEFAPILGSYSSPDEVADEIEAVIETVDPLTSLANHSRRIQIIHGTEDQVIPFGQSMDICAANQAIALTPMVGQGHDFEDRDALTETIARVLDC